MMLATHPEVLRHIQADLTVTVITSNWNQPFRESPANRFHFTSNAAEGGKPMLSPPPHRQLLTRLLRPHHLLQRPACACSSASLDGPSQSAPWSPARAPPSAFVRPRPRPAVGHSPPRAHSNLLHRSKIQRHRRSAEFRAPTRLIWRGLPR